MCFEMLPPQSTKMGEFFRHKQLIQNHFLTQASGISAKKKLNWTYLCKASGPIDRLILSVKL